MSQRRPIPTVPPLAACVAAAAALLAGCGGPAAEAPPPAADVRPDRPDAGRALAAAVQQARLHLEFDEPAKAEDVLEKALADAAGAGDATAALSLLADAKRRLRAAERPPAADEPGAGESAGASLAAVTRPFGAPAEPGPAEAEPADSEPADSEPADSEPADSPIGPRSDRGGVSGAVTDAAPAPVAAAGSDGVAVVRVAPESSPDAAAGTGPPAGTGPAPEADRPAAGARDAVRAVKAAENLSTAAGAVAALDRFAAARDLDADAARLVAAARAGLEPRAAAGEVRSGRDWVAPAERDDRRRRAAAAVRAGLAGLEVGNLAAARQQFEAASAADPDGVLGDLWLGTGYSLAGALWDAAAARGAALIGARKHFAEAARRRPGSVPALNNLALAEWKSGDVRAALAAWEAAVEVAPASPQLAHNVGRANRLAGAGLATANRRDARRLGDLYASLAAAGGDHDATVGWLIMPPVDPLAVDPDAADGPETGDDSAGAGPPAAPGDFVTVAFGSGFCAAPGYVLTNRHVAVPGDGDGDGGDGADGSIGGRRYDRLAVAAGGAEYEAELVAVSSDRDLALLRVPGLAAAPLPLAAGRARLAEGVLALGFPRPEALGGGLKTTRGAVVGLPDGQADGMLLFDAAVTPGNSGGPVCDARGAVAAVATKIFLIEQGLSAGVTAADARRFLLAALPADARGDLPPPPAERAAGAGGDWAAVAEAAAPAAVQVLCGVAPDRLDSGFSSAGEVAGDAGPGGAGWEDRSCPVCLGGGERRCPANGCSNGEVQVRRRVQVSYDPLKKRPIYGVKSFPARCDRCRGGGAVRCDHCRGASGVDPDLR